MQQFIPAEKLTTRTRSYSAILINSCHKVSTIMMPKCLPNTYTKAQMCENHAPQLCTHKKEPRTMSW